MRALLLFMQICMQIIWSCILPYLFINWYFYCIIVTIIISFSCLLHLRILLELWKMIAVMDKFMLFMQLRYVSIKYFINTIFSCSWIFPFFSLHFIKLFHMIILLKFQEMLAFLYRHIYKLFKLFLKWVLKLKSWLTWIILYDWFFRYLWYF